MKSFFCLKTFLFCCLRSTTKGYGSQDQLQHKETQVYTYIIISKHKRFKMYPWYETHICRLIPDSHTWSKLANLPPFLQSCPFHKKSWHSVKIKPFLEGIPKLFATKPIHPGKFPQKTYFSKISRIGCHDHLLQILIHTNYVSFIIHSQNCLAPGTRRYASHPLEVYNLCNTQGILVANQPLFSLISCLCPTLSTPFWTCQYWCKQRNWIKHMHRFLPLLALTPGFHCSCHGDSKRCCMEVVPCVSCNSFVATHIPLMDGVILRMDLWKKHYLIFQHLNTKLLYISIWCSLITPSVHPRFQRKFN